MITTVIKKESFFYILGAVFDDNSGIVVTLLISPDGEIVDGAPPVAVGFLL